MIEFRMPSLGADMEAGLLVEWLVKPGDAVRRGRPVAVVETQKGAIEVEIFAEGTVAELVVPVGTRVAVGAVLARLTDSGTAMPAAQAAPAPVAAPADVTVAVPVTAAPVAPPRGPADRVRATPAARQRAAALGLDLGSLQGTGVDGAVCLADLPQPRAQPSPPRARRAGFDPAEMRKAIAAAMARSKREIPHYYLTSTVELSRALTWLEERNAGRAPTDRLLPAALLLRATARALAKVPELNGFWVGDTFQPGGGVHVGWAIALRGGGLVAPAIRDADRRGLDDLMGALRDLVQRARTGGLRSSEMSDPTITVTSLGDRGAESVLPVIYPPQVAMVGFGRIVTRAWAVEGAVGPRPVVTVSLAGDHRASDGHRGGLLLAEIDRLLQEPQTL